MKELALLQACRAGASDVVLEMVLEDAGMVTVESEGKKRTPLLVAARAGRRDVVQLLLGGEHGGRALVSVDHQDVDGKTALQLAAFHGDAEVVALLLAAGADALLADARGLTPLHIASWQGHPEVVALLLDYHAAASSSSLSAAPHMIQAAAPYYCSSSRPSSLPRRGAQGGRGRVAGGGHRRRVRPYSSEQEAQQAEGEEVMEDDDDDDDGEGGMEGLVDAVGQGLGLGGSEAGAGVTAAGNSAGGGGVSPRQGATAAASSLFLSLVSAKPRRDYWAVIDAVDSRGRSALYMAASYEQAEVVQCLLGRGANPLLAGASAGEGGKRRPLDRAAATGNKPIIGMLLEAEREPQRLLALAQLRRGIDAQLPVPAPAPTTTIQEAASPHPSLSTAVVGMTDDGSGSSGSSISSAGTDTDNADKSMMMTYTEWVTAVGTAAARDLPEDVWGELMDAMAPWWMC